LEEVWLFILQDQRTDSLLGDPNAGMKNGWELSKKMVMIELSAQHSSGILWQYIISIIIYYGRTPLFDAFNSFLIRNKEHQRTHDSTILAKLLQIQPFHKLPEVVLVSDLGSIGELVEEQGISHDAKGPNIGLLRITGLRHPAMTMRGGR